MQLTLMGDAMLKLSSTPFDDFHSNDKIIEAIIFDCDGVLIDSEIIANRMEVEELQKHGYPITLDDYNNRFSGNTTEDAFRILAVENNDIFSPDFLNEVEKKTLLVLEKEAKCIAGVKQVLEIISLPKAVASNAYVEKLHKLLEQAQLTKYFKDHIYSADMVVHPKPFPDLYLLAARELDVPPERCLVIEDSEAGVKAAKAAGMHVFGFIGASHHRSFYASVLEAAGAETTFDDMLLLPELLQLMTNCTS